MTVSNLNVGRILGCSNSELADLLDASRWVKDWEWSCIERLAEYLSAYEFQAEQELFNEGDSESYLGIVVDGELRVEKRDGTGARKTLARLPRGSTFGEMSLLDQQPRSAAVVAGSTTQLLILTSKSFKRLIMEQPGLGVQLLLKLAMLLSARLRRTSGQLVDHLEG